MPCEHAGRLSGSHKPTSRIPLNSPTARTFLLFTTAAKPQLYVERLFALQRTPRSAIICIRREAIFGDSSLRNGSRPLFLLMSLAIPSIRFSSRSWSFEINRQDLPIIMRAFWRVSSESLSSFFSCHSLPWYSTSRPASSNNRSATSFEREHSLAASSLRQISAFNLGFPQPHPPRSRGRLSITASAVSLGDAELSIASLPT